MIWSSPKSKGYCNISDIARDYELDWRAARKHTDQENFPSPEIFRSRKYWLKTQVKKYFKSIGY